MQYRPLKEFVEKRGGLRLRCNAGLRERIIDMAVEEFPADAPEDRKEEVLRARLRLRIRREYGSIVASILIGVIVNLIVRLIVEWWKRRHSHQVLIMGWQNALAAARIQAEKKA